MKETTRLEIVYVYDQNGDDYMGVDDVFTAASHFGEESP
jgi:hypothetical protein